MESEDTPPRYRVPGDAKRIRAPRRPEPEQVGKVPEAPPVPVPTHIHVHIPPTTPQAKPSGKRPRRYGQQVKPAPAMFGGRVIVGMLLMILAAGGVVIGIMWLHKQGFL